MLDLGHFQCSDTKGIEPQIRVTYGSYYKVTDILDIYKWCCGPFSVSLLTNGRLKC